MYTTQRKKDVSRLRHPTTGEHTVNMPDWRERMRMTQHQAAAALGISRSLVAMIEGGGRRIDRRTEYAMRWLAHLAGVDLDAPPAPIPANIETRLAALEARLSPTWGTSAPMHPPSPMLSVRPAMPAIAPEARPASRPAIPLSAVDDASMRERMERKIAELAALDDDE